MQRHAPLAHLDSPAIVHKKFAIATALSDRRRVNKELLVEQLRTQLSAAARAALAASELLAHEAKEGATPDEKREDARAAHQVSSMGRAQDKRARIAMEQADSLLHFRPTEFPPTSTVMLGAIVEIEDTETNEGRTFFLAPVGAGTTLTGPGGDGYLSVVTPASPIGRAVIGKRAGDTVDVTVDGDTREWAITFVG